MATINNAPGLTDPNKRYGTSNAFYKKYYPSSSGTSQAQDQTQPQTFGDNPFNSDPTSFKPTGFPNQWQEEGIKTPDATVDPNDFMDGWDYRNPPLDPNTGKPLDFNGNPLPDGATAWTPLGEPDFTPAGRTDLAATFEGWIKGMQYRMYQDVNFDESGKNPFTSAWDKWLHQENKPNLTAEGIATAAEENLQDAWGIIQNIGPGLRTLQSEEGAPSPLTMGGRLIAEIGRGVGSAFNLFAKTAESLIGTGQLTQQALSEGSVLPEINYPDWVPGWAVTLANTVTPLAAYNSLREIVAPKKSWDEIKDILAESWQASRITYSIINDETLRDEYIRRYKAGEDPRYLAMELENPIDELIGQLIFDPLNIAGYFARGEETARRLGKISEVYLTPSGALDDVFKGMKAENLADGMNSLEGLASAVQKEIVRVGQNLDELSTNRGLMQLTTAGKRSDLANRSGQILRFIFANTRKAENGAYDFDKAMEIIRGMINMADPNNLDNVAAAVNDVAKSASVPRPLFSRAGLEYSIIMRNLLGGTEDVAETLPGIARGLDFEGFLRGFEEAKAGGIDEVVAWATKKLDAATTGYFPTVLEQARAADRLAEYEKTGQIVLASGETLQDVQRAARYGKVSELSQFVAKFDAATKGKIYTPINRFFANVYMGMSPGFAFRNLINNAATIGVDAGIGSIFVGKEKAINGVKNLLGGVVNPRIAGFGSATKGVEGATEAGKGFAWYQKGLQMSENFEELGAAQISFKAVKDVMRRILQPGKALPDIAPLVDAGLPVESANLLSRLVVEFDGNVNKAFARFRELAAGGNIDVTRTLTWLTGDDVRIAQNMNKWDSLKDILQSEMTLSEKQSALRALVPEMENFADLAKGEMTGLTDAITQDEGRGIMATAMNAATEGSMSDAEAAIANHRIWANAYTRRSYYEVVRSIREDGWLVFEQAGDTENALKLRNAIQPVQETMESTWYKVMGEHDDYTRLVVARTKEIKGGSGGMFNYAQVWEELKMPGDLPPNMDNATMVDAMWNHWRNLTRDRFATAREAVVSLAEAGWQDVAEKTGYVPSKALLDNAREYLSQARAYDDAIVDTTAIGPMVFQKRDMIISALQRGDAKTAIAILADHYGIASATKGGKYFDNAILNTFRAYTGRAKGFTLQDALKSVNDVPEEFRKLMQETAQSMIRDLEEGGVSFKPAPEQKHAGHLVRESKNPDWYRALYNQGYKSKKTFISALQRIIDGQDGGDLKYLSAVKRAVWEQLQAESANYQEIVDILSGKGKKFENLSIDEVWQAFEAQRSAKGKSPLIANLDEYLGRTTPRPPIEPIPLTGQQTQLPISSASPTATVGGLNPQDITNPGSMGTLGPVQETLPMFQTPGGVRLDSKGKPIPLPTPYMDGTMPTGPRATKENLEGMKRWLESLAQRLEANTGKLTPVDFTPEVEKALSGWTNAATNNIAEGRLMASAYADVMRDFALHDYGSKRNIDLAAAYLFPYEFWYTRTYKNWMTRLVTNPETIAAYAKYRTALEHIHAGAPEWWKYNIQIPGELLGQGSDNPLFFNLEATLNPLNGLTGTDFTDPAKRVDWLTRTVDDIGKFGPSIWTPISTAIAFSLYAKGENDAAARWAGRLIPQTAQIRTIGAMFNTNVEFDPFVLFFSGGQDPYEQRRAATALSALAQGTYVNGEYVKITDEQAIDAANPTVRKNNPEAQAIWDMATQYALDRRTLGTLSSYFLGVGFKGRNTSELAVDKMYADYYKLWNTSSMMSGEQFRVQMEQMHIKYPWMDSILLAKKAGPEVDRALAYNALSRIPPGQSGDILKAFGLSDDMMKMFYDNKGDLSTMTPEDRMRFMAGIVDLSAALALPDDASRIEWTTAKNRYNLMQDAITQNFGEDIDNKLTDFFLLQKSNPDAAKLYLQQNPLIEQALQFREDAVMNDPLLFDYYGGIDFLEKYWTGEMYTAAEKQFGSDVFITSATYGQLADQESQLLDQYYRMKDNNDPNAKAFYAQYLDKDSNQKDLFLAAHPELKDYWALKRNYKDEIDQRLTYFADKIRDVRPELRQDYQPQGVYEVPAAQQLGYQFPQAPTWNQYASMFSSSQRSLLEDYFNGGKLSPSMKTSMTRIAEGMGMSLDQLLSTLEVAYYNEQVPAP